MEKQNDPRLLNHPIARDSKVLEKRTTIPLFVHGFSHVLELGWAALSIVKSAEPLASGFLAQECHQQKDVASFG